MFHCSMCPSDAPSSANDHSAALHQQPGTLFLLLSLTVTLSLYLNLGLKLTYLILHTANGPALPAPLKLRHYGAIQMYYYFYYYCYYPYFNVTTRQRLSRNRAVTCCDYR